MAEKKVYKLTQESMDNLTDELKHLKTVREREVAEQIKEARSFGDLSENSEYDEAKNEQGKLYSRIAEIENILQNAELLETGGEFDKASVGVKVKLRDKSNDEVIEYAIVGTQEANPMRGRISDESPLGKAIIGHGAGDEVTFDSLVGVRKYIIEEINPS
ncbi:transcription elongation factor GreA [Clostridia bacterium]|nr:transcription elongation factor GreA [Clostridia bacterium]